MPDLQQHHSIQGPSHQPIVYFLLARLWSHEVDVELLADLTTPPVRQAYQNAGGWLPADPVNAAMIDHWSIEFCQCFLGPSGHLPPYQSVVASSRFQSDCCDSLKQFKEIIGPIESPGIKDQPMPDHAATVLAMMGQLQLALQRAADSGESATAASIQEIANDFHARHLIWLADYCAVAAQRQTSLFYCGVFAVTKDLLAGYNQADIDS